LSDLEDIGDDSQDESSGEDGENAEPPSLGKRKGDSRPEPKPSKKRPEKKAKRGPRVSIGYEEEKEMETVPLSRSAVANW